MKRILATETMQPGTTNAQATARATELQSTFAGYKVIINGSTERGFRLDIKK